MRTIDHRKWKMATRSITAAKSCAQHPEGPNYNIRTKAPQNSRGSGYPEPHSFQLQTQVLLTPVLKWNSNALRYFHILTHRLNTSIVTLIVTQILLKRGCQLLGERPLRSSGNTRLGFFCLGQAQCTRANRPTLRTTLPSRPGKRSPKNLATPCHFQSNALPDWWWS